MPFVPIDEGREDGEVFVEPVILGCLGLGGIDGPLPTALIGAFMVVEQAKEEVGVDVVGDLSEAFGGLGATLLSIVLHLTLAIVEEAEEDIGVAVVVHLIILTVAPDVIVEEHPPEEGRSIVTLILELPADGIECDAVPGVVQLAGLEVLREVIGINGGEVGTAESSGTCVMLETFVPPPEEPAEGVPASSGPLPRMVGQDFISCAQRAQEHGPLRTLLTGPRAFVQQQV